MKEKSLIGIHFCGNKASDYAIEHGYLDYATLAKSFDAVYNDSIIDFEVDYWEIINGNNCTYYDADGNEVEPGEDYDHEEYAEIFQWFIISERGAEILRTWTGEIVYYNEKLNIYLWGVTHWGTSWDHVLTNIKLNDPHALDNI